MNYHKSKTVLAARRKGHVVIMNPLSRVGAWRMLRVPKSKMALWQKGVSTAGAKRSDLYSVDCRASVITMCAMINGWKLYRGLPTVDFKEEEVSIEYFYSMACLCAKLKLFPKVRG